MKLRELLSGVEVLEWHAPEELEIGGVSYDSRETAPGDLFVAMTGYAADGHDFIPMARGKGAVCILCERAPEDAQPWVKVAHSRRALALLSANWFSHPAEEMTMIGVTGTNGKTTTTYLLKEVLEREAGAAVGLIGTNQILIGTEVLEAERTTPESFELHRLFRKMREAGCTYVVMEVSSHALFLDRVYGIPFEVGIFTNLTQDHLDFHKTMEAYCDAKARLFSMCRVGVVNGDDPWHKRLLEHAACQVLTYAEQAPADLRAENVSLSAAGVAFDAVTKSERQAIFVGIPGGFMVYNTLDVLAAALALGIPLKDSAAALRQSRHVKGRVEVVPLPGAEYTVLIDYAHTPDAVENVLRSVRGFAKGRVVALLGCGGDRDKTKRPKMGAAAAALADLVIVTSDNPRTEDPRGIIQDILAGMYRSQTPHIVVEDRAAAIVYAMDQAQKDDVIVLMGKGHETYQIVGAEKRHLDEREIVAAHWKQTHNGL
ncbi:UDP-N-acetylmuramoyl-L-alanyl-D-glutamate--2,6-diaminopimelate ligase [Ruthenibacterium lactatiformans]|uniref:UDP-N-acetylmuramoyl-L-alanyl-D-glutamate--2, 6-diaminopimelate ligase n=1 Tax=Ruthenibacterium lactatiformans TaxID=1550024 RepID=UPI00351FD396